MRLQLLEAIETAPGVDARRLAQAVGSSPPRLYYHLKILVDAGLIQVANHGARASARGPAATCYECCTGVVPSAILGAAGVRAEHFSRVRTQIFDAKRPAAEPDIACFAREALRADEIDSVRRLMRELKQILSAARVRRRNGRALAPATAFVAMCLADLRLPTLPDSHLEVDGRP